MNYKNQKIKTNIGDLTRKDKEQLFKDLMPAIRFSIKESYQKFDCIPLEEDDLLYHSWVAFETSIELYATKKIKAPFVSFLIREVKRACIIECKKYVGNKYKVVNFALPMVEETTFDPNDVSLADKRYEYFPYKDLLDNYFEENHDKATYELFMNYVNGASVRVLIDECHMSRRTIQRKIDTIVYDLKEILVQ